MNDQKAERLAAIRQEVEKWRALYPNEVATWESPFLLDIIDEKNAQLKGANMDFMAKAGEMTIIFPEGRDISWFVQKALKLGLTIQCERIEEWQK